MPHERLTRQGSLTLEVRQRHQRLFTVALTRVRVTRMLEFAGFEVRLCRTLLTQCRGCRPRSQGTTRRSPVKVGREVLRRGDAMTMDRALRLWFLALYAIGIVGFLSNVLRIRRHRPAFEQQIGPLPEVGALVAWFLPPLIILSRIGRMTIEQPIVRVLGVVLSLYSQIMVAWTVRTLGRHLIPGLAVFRDHVLVTSGPFRWVRHPLYSGALALWLGAGLGTLNWL